MARLTYTDDISGERIANFYIGREWHEVLESDKSYHGVQCDECGSGDLTTDFTYMAGLVARLICDDCGVEYPESLDAREDATRAMNHIFAGRR